MLGPTQNMSIYRKRNGEYALRRKGGPTAKRFAKDPNYAQARINTSEFGQAAKGSALIRKAFRTMIPKVANDVLHSRLTGVCKAVINSDSTQPRGSRMLMNGDLSLLRNFSFNPEGKLGLLGNIPFHHTTDRNTGIVRIGMPAFAPAGVIRFPKHATHARLKAGVAVLDFGQETFTFASTSSTPFSKGNKPINPEELTVQIPAGTSSPLFIAMAIEFMIWEKGVFIPVLNCDGNSMQLTGVDVAVAAAAQPIPAQEEILIVAETETNTPMLKSTSPVLHIPAESEHSAKQHACNLPEQPPVQDTQQRPEKKVCRNTDQIPDHHTRSDNRRKTKPICKTLAQQPDKQADGRAAPFRKYREAVNDASWPAYEPEPYGYRIRRGDTRILTEHRSGVVRILRRNPRIPDRRSIKRLLTQET